jgi:hypothetical protein
MTACRIVAAFVAALALGIGCGGGSQDDEDLVGPSPGSGGNLASTGGGSGISLGGSVVAGAGPTGGSGGSESGFASLVECNDTYENLAQCGTSAVTADVRPVDILLVVDKSGSMTVQPAGYDDRKWPALRDALSYALGELMPYARFGLELFPRKDVTLDCEAESCCLMGTSVDVPIGEGAETVPLILAELAEPTGPGGSTPTAEALRVAYDYFTTTGVGIEGQGTERFVFLATDGGPNCGAVSSCPASECTLNLDGTYADYPYYCVPEGPANCCDPNGEILGAHPRDCLDDDATLAEIQRLYDRGIRTAVVGIPGSEPYEAALNAFAEAGGTPNPRPGSSYYQVEANRPEQLTEVFIGVVMDLVKSCDIHLEEDPPGLDLINIALDCEAIPRIDPETGAENWQLDTSTSPPTIRLVGALCDEALSVGIRRIDVLFGCQTIG